MADGLERGESLDQAMVGVASRFPPPLRGLMVAGARSGKLADVLGQYVRYANLGGELRRRFWMAVAYPDLPARRAGGPVRLPLLLGRRGVRVRPEGLRRRAAGGHGTPLPDGRGDAGRAGLQVVDDGRPSSPRSATSCFACRWGPAERRMLVSSIPMFGPLLRWTSLAEFCHLAGLLVEAEMPLPEALELAGRGVGDAELARAGETLRASVEEGRTAVRVPRRLAPMPGGAHRSPRRLRGPRRPRAGRSTWPATCSRRGPEPQPSFLTTFFAAAGPPAHPLGRRLRRDGPLPADDQPLHEDHVMAGLGRGYRTRMRTPLAGARPRRPPAGAAAGSSGSGTSWCSRS